MADTTFSDVTGTPIVATWLNDVNNHVYKGKVLDGTSWTSVTDPTYGAVGDGVADDAPAINAAWQHIKTTGGVLYLAPKTYLCKSQLLFDVDLTAPRNYLVVGYGATITSSSAVTGHAIKVSGGFNNYGLQIEGLNFNHRNNTTVNGCIQAVATANLKIVNCTVEHHNTKSTYAGIEIGPSTPGTANTGSFWTTIKNFRTRMRSGGDGTDAAVGVRLVASANATIIEQCSFSSVVDAIQLVEDGTITGGIPNGVVIRENAFEGVSVAVKCVATPGTGSMPTGLRVIDNRVESTTTFFSMTTGGAAASNASHPPILRDNYLVSGSVTNAVVNPNNQLYSISHPRFFGISELNNEVLNASKRVTLNNTQANFEIADINGISTFDSGHLVLGTFHIWVDSSSRLRIKNGVPTSQTDGVVVGTQT